MSFNCTLTDDYSTNLFIKSTIYQTIEETNAFGLVINIITNELLLDAALVPLGDYSIKWAGSGYPEGDYLFEFTVFDRVGNYTEYTTIVIKDITSPYFTNISLSNDRISPNNDGYYDQARFDFITKENIFNSIDEFRLYLSVRVEEMITNIVTLPDFENMGSSNVYTNIYPEYSYKEKYLLITNSIPRDLQISHIITNRDVFSTNINDDRYYLSMYGIDSAGNSSELFRTSLEIDTTPPKTTIGYNRPLYPDVATKTAYIGSNTFMIFRVNDMAVSRETNRMVGTYYIITQSVVVPDTNLFSTYNYFDTFSFQGYDEGLYYLYCYSIDDMRNQEHIKTNRIYLDKTPPVIIITGATQGSTYSNKIDVFVEAHDVIPTNVQIWLNDQEITNDTFNIDKSGIYTIEVIAYDAVNNTSSTMFTFTLNKNIEGIPENVFAYKSGDNVVIGWDHLIEEGVVGYNVYRYTVLGNITNDPEMLNIEAITQNRFTDITIPFESLDQKYYYTVRARNMFDKVSDESDPGELVVMDGVITLLSPDNFHYYCDEILVKANMRVLTNNTSVTLEIGKGENPNVWLEVTNFQGWNPEDETNIYYFDIKKYDNVQGWQIWDDVYRLRLRASSLNYYYEDNVKLTIDRFYPVTEISNWRRDEDNTNIYFVNYTRIKIEGYDTNVNGVSSGLKEIRYGFDTNNYFLYVPGNLVLEEGIHTFSFYGVDKTVRWEIDSGLDGNVEPKRYFLLFVDTALPEAEIDRPFNREMVTNTNLPLRIIAKDNNILGWDISYKYVPFSRAERIGAEYEYVPIISGKSNTEGSSGDFVTNWIITNLISGYYDIRLRVEDKAFNITEDTIRVMILRPNDSLPAPLDCRLFYAAYSNNSNADFALGDPQCYEGGYRLNDVGYQPKPTSALGSIYASNIGARYSAESNIHPET